LTPLPLQSWRAAVAGKRPDLSSSDVVVYDMLNFQSYQADKEGEAFDSSLISWIREHTRTYEDKIRGSLAFIPGVKVSVTVDVENLKRSVETTVKYDAKNSIPKYQSDVTRTESFSQQPVKAEPGARSNEPLNLQTTPSNQKSREANDTTSTIVNAPASTTILKEFIPAFPSKVSVAVAIPEDYYKKALEKQAAEGGQAKKIEQLQAEVTATVKQLAAKSIPGGDPEQISVTSFVQVDPDVPKIETSAIDTVSSLASQWGGSIGIALFALWALMTLRKSAPKAPPEEPPMPVAMPGGGMPMIAPATTATVTVGGVTEEVNSPRENTERDLLQGMVRDNPEAAAAVLSKWLLAAK
jgi:flagellar biosynthesis/type III secretory pathway M-ring protein FliF/YscJ